jgi:hypothetical protein
MNSIFRRFLNSDRTKSVEFRRISAKCVKFVNPALGSSLLLIAARQPQIGLLAITHRSSASLPPAAIHGFLAALAGCIPTPTPLPLSAQSQAARAERLGPLPICDGPTEAAAEVEGARTGEVCHT